MTDGKTSAEQFVLEFLKSKNYTDAAEALEKQLGDARSTASPSSSPSRLEDLLRRMDLSKDEEKRHNRVVSETEARTDSQVSEPRDAAAASQFLQVTKLTLSSNMNTSVGALPSPAGPGLRLHTDTKKTNEDIQLPPTQEVEEEVPRDPFSPIADVVESPQAIPALVSSGFEFAEVQNVQPTVGLWHKEIETTPTPPGAASEEEQFHTAVGSDHDDEFADAEDEEWGDRQPPPVFVAPVVPLKPAAALPSDEELLQNLLNEKPQVRRPVQGFEMHSGQYADALLVASPLDVADGCDSDEYSDDDDVGFKRIPIEESDFYMMAADRDTFRADCALYEGASEDGAADLYQQYHRSYAAVATGDDDDDDDDAEGSSSPSTGDDLGSDHGDSLLTHHDQQPSTVVLDEHLPNVHSSGASTDSAATTSVSTPPKDASASTTPAAIVSTTPAAIVSAPADSVPTPAAIVPGPSLAAGSAGGGDDDGGEEGGGLDKSLDSESLPEGGDCGVGLTQESEPSEIEPDSVGASMLDLHTLPTTLEEFKRLRREIIFDSFDLKVVFERNRTGFEESKDFPIELESMVAGRYQVVEYLGSAAFSKAIQCIDYTDGSHVCIKIIKNNKDFFDQSLDEIKLLKFINSHDPNDEKYIVQIYDFFYHKEHLFIVCELLRDNLYEFSKFNRESGGEYYFNLPRLQRITKQILTALEYIHSLFIIHCDLKPENILIKSYSRCEVKIIDFGSSCFVTDHLSSYVQSRSYRAPEVILGMAYDQKIDMWSLGCILAELFTGNVLFQNDSVQTLLSRVIGIMGPVFTPDYLARGRYSHKFFTKDYVLFEKRADCEGYFLVQPKKTSLKKRLKTDDEQFLDFVSQLLRVKPEERLSATEALKHPWLTEVVYDYEI